MSQSITCYPVFDMGAGPRTRSLRFWLPLDALFPEVISSKHVAHDKALISAYYASRFARHNLREKLVLNKQVTLFMDSGGYQIFSRNLSFSPEDTISVLRYQEENEANLAATIDFPYQRKKTSILEGWRRIEISVKYALLALKYRRMDNLKLYAVLHGWDLLTVKKVTSILAKHEFDGFCLGAPLMKDKVNSKSTYLLNLVQMVYGVKEVIGEKPLHIFGVGNSPAIHLLAKLGVDSFDTLRYLHSAKYREYMLPQGSYVMVGRSAKSGRKIKHLPCSCPICLNVDAAMLSMNGSKPGALLAMHNLLTLLNLVKLINTAKQEGWYGEMLVKATGEFPVLESSVRWLKKQG